MKMWMWIIGLLLAAAAWRSVLFVDETQMVIVTQFGRPVGEPLLEPGLYFKWPYQSWLGIDRRVQIYNPRPAEFLTSEKKNINLDVFVCWRVLKPQQFMETVNDLPGAESRLQDVVWSKVAAQVGRKKLEHLLNTKPESRELDDLMSSVAKDCRDEVGAKYGIQLVDVRVKRISLPDQVRSSVFERMRTERAQMAEKYRSEGKEEGLKIRAEADKQKTVLLAQAYAEAEITRGKAEAEATRVYGAAHQKDPAFYELLRTLEAYRKILDEKTTILLSSDSDLLRYLTRGSMLPGNAPEAKK